MVEDQVWERDSAISFIETLMQAIQHWLQEHGHSPERNTLHDSQLASSISQTASEQKENIPMPVEQQENLRLVPGGTVRISERWYLHWCKHCMEPFRSRDENPDTCKRRNCRKRGWRTGRDFRRRQDD